MLNPTLCDYSNAYIIAKGPITITGANDDPLPEWEDGRKMV